MGDVTGEFFIKELQDHIRRDSGRQNSWENSEKRSIEIRRSFPYVQ